MTDMTKRLSEKPRKKVSKGKKSSRQPLRVYRPPLPKEAAKAQPSRGFTEHREAMS
jgi:hypothetical protein